MIHLENVLKISLHVLKTSSTRLEDIFARRLEDVLKTSSVEVRLRRAYSSCSRRLEDVLKTSSEDKDVRRLQDECLLVGFFLYTLKIFWKDQKIRGFFFYVFSFKANQSTGFHVTTTLVFKEWILIMAKYLTWVTA